MNNINKTKLLAIGFAGGIMLQLTFRKDINMDDCIYICRKILEALEDCKTRNIFS